VGTVVVALAAVGAYAVWRSRSGSTPPSTSAAMPRIESLAVLPLANMSADGSQEYFADAMTEELIRELSGIKSLRVISRTSTAQYKGVKRNIPDIAKELHVDGIIEGSVVRAGDEVRITAQLIHGPTDRHLWANAYDGDLRDMLALQRRVAEAIAREVRATVTPEEQQTLRASRSIDPRSMDLYLRGRQLLYQATSTSSGFSRPTIERALTSFADALKIEQWAGPYAGVAAVRHFMATGGINPTVLFPASREAALEAIRLDDRLADGHNSLGYVSFAYYWDLATAERELRRAIDLNPSGNYYLGYALLLEALGRLDEGRTKIGKAEELDPLAAIVKAEQLRARLFAKDNEGALQYAQRLPDSFPKTMAHAFMGRALLGQRRFSEAITEFGQAGPGLESRAAVASALARAGRTGEARARLRELEGAEKTADDAYDLAGVYVSLGERARGLDALERAYDRKRTWLPLINVDPSFDDLRGDARFTDLLRRVGIPAGSVQQSALKQR
jgi:TolB-like protein